MGAKLLILWRTQQDSNRRLLRKGGCGFCAQACLTYSNGCLRFFHISLYIKARSISVVPGVDTHGSGA